MNVAMWPRRRQLLSTLSILVVFLLSLFVSAGTAEACHGSVIIRKVETGLLAPGADHRIVMTDESGEVVADVIVGAGSSVQIDNVAQGRYFFAEPDGPVGATIVPASVTIHEDGQIVEVIATNPYPGASFEVTKRETGTAAPGGVYTFDVSGPESFEFTVAAGETWRSGILPLGAYTLVERDAPSGHTISPNPVVLDEDGEVVTVEAVNPFRDLRARMSIRKVVTGPEMPGHAFTMDVTGPVDFSVEVAAGETWTSDWLPLGTYTVTEVDPFDGHTIVPNPVVLDEDGETVVVTVTNPWPAGRIEVRKVQLGGVDPAAQYNFSLEGPSFQVSFALRAGEVWTSEWLELGTYTITEHDGPPGHTIEPNPVVLDEDGATVIVTATNPGARGRLSIEKVVIGEPVPGRTYRMSVDGPVSFVVEIAAGETWTSDLLPLGRYTVQELNAPPGATVVPDEIEIDEDGETVRFVVTNPEAVGRIAIRKVEIGTNPPNGTYRFTIAGPVDVTAVVRAGETWTSDWLEFGTYTITEFDGPLGHTIVPNPVVIDEDGETVVVIVTNPGGILPATGGGDLTRTVDIGVAFVATGGVLVLIGHRRRRGWVC